MINLTTHYLGLTLKTPLVASASPLTRTLEHLIELEKAGAGAVVLPSLFEEEIEKERRAMEYHFDTGMNSSLETSSYFVESENFQSVIGTYLKLVRDAVTTLNIPVIASINAGTDYGWVDIAKQIEEAGAHALELNVYNIPTDFSLSSVTIENNLIAILNLVKQTVSIPIALKIGPWYSAMGNFAKRINDSGASGLVMFNRFYQPDFNMDKFEVENTLTLSTKNEIRLPLTWIGLLYSEVEMSLAATSGVETYEEVVKYLMAGADVVMTTSALLRYGPGYLETLQTGLSTWMQARGYSSIEQLRGCMSHRRAGQAQQYERVQYLKTLRAYEV